VTLVGLGALVECVGRDFVVGLAVDRLLDTDGEAFLFEAGLGGVGWCCLERVDVLERVVYGGEGIALGLCCGVVLFDSLDGFELELDQGRCEVDRVEDKGFGADLQVSLELLNAGGGLYQKLSR